MDSHQLGSGKRSSRGRRVALWWLGWYVALVLLWLLYVDSFDLPEVLAGLVAALVASLATIGLHVHGGVRFRLRLRWFLLARSIPASVLRDSALLAKVLWRRVVRHEPAHGAFRLVRLSSGGDDPAGAAWRAFSITATSVSPNTYVVGIDREQGTALVHQLALVPAREARSAVIGAGQ